MAARVYHGLPGLTSIHVSCLHHLSDFYGAPPSSRLSNYKILQIYPYNFQYIICLSLYPNIPNNDGFASLVVFYGYFSAYPHDIP